MTYGDVVRFGQELEDILARKKKTSNDLIESDWQEINQSQSVSTNASLRQDSVHDGVDESENQSISRKDCLVTVEVFDGFVFEQRSEPETVRQISKPIVEDDETDLSYFDDSFMVDGFKIKASSSLGLLQKNRATNTALGSKESRKKRKRTAIQNKKYLKMKFQRRPGSKSNFRFCEGDVVAWFPTRHGESQDVFTGIVVSVPQTTGLMTDESHMIMVEFLAAIPARPGQESDTQRLKVTPSFTNDVGVTGSQKSFDTVDVTTKPIPPIGSGVWIPFEDLHLVQEHADVAYPEDLREMRRKRKKLVSTGSTTSISSTMIDSATNKARTSVEVNAVVPLDKISKKYKSRAMSYSQRFKESTRLSQSDMSLAPKKPAKQLADGSFQMPQGRRPGKLKKLQKILV
jgi:hypothetical protein